MIEDSILEDHVTLMDVSTLRSDVYPDYAQAFHARRLVPHSDSV